MMRSFFACSFFVASVCACPRATLVGAPCDGPDDEPEVCEDIQKLRCDGNVYVVQAPCHHDCTTGTGTAHELAQIDADETFACAAGPHIITGLAQVLPGATLTIEPGTAVRIDASSRIDVDPAAKVIIEASSAAPVLMTSNSGDAGGFGDSSSGALNLFSVNAEEQRSSIRNLIVERGFHGVSVNGVSATTLAPIIENSTFRDNTNFGIRLTCSGDNPPLPPYDSDESGNQFFENGDGGMSGCTNE